MQDIPSQLCCKVDTSRQALLGAGLLLNQEGAQGLKAGGRYSRQAQAAHLRGQHFDQLIQEAKFGHLVVELLPTVVHTHLQHLHGHGSP